MLHEHGACMSTKALEDASFLGYSKSVRLLLELGIIPTDKALEYASSYASCYGRIDVIRLLLERCSDEYAYKLITTIGNRFSTEVYELVKEHSLK